LNVCEFQPKLSSPSLAHVPIAHALAGDDN